MKNDQKQQIAAALRRLLDVDAITRDVAAVRVTDAGEDLATEESAAEVTDWLVGEAAARLPGLPVEAALDLAAVSGAETWDRGRGRVVLDPIARLVGTVTVEGGMRVALGFAEGERGVEYAADREPAAAFDRLPPLGPADAPDADDQLRVEGRGEPEYRLDTTVPEGLRRGQQDREIDELLDPVRGTDAELEHVRTLFHEAWWQLSTDDRTAVLASEPVAAIRGGRPVPPEPDEKTQKLVVYYRYSKSYGEHERQVAEALAGRDVEVVAAIRERNPQTRPGLSEAIAAARRAGAEVLVGGAYRHDRTYEVICHLLGRGGVSFSWVGSMWSRYSARRA